jgi:chromosomal replication initiator protein
VARGSGPAERFEAGLRQRLPAALVDVLLPAVEITIADGAVRLQAAAPHWAGVLERHGEAIRAAATAAGLTVTPARPGPGGAGGPGFAGLIPDPGNRMALAACQRAVEAPGLDHNPVYLHGPAGAGKSHLLAATADEAALALGEAAVVRLNGAELGTGLAQELADGDAPLRRALDQALLVTIDGIDGLAERPLAQEELFHLINRARDQGQQIVAAGRLAPRRLVGIEERLTTRLSWGLVVAVEAPLAETRAALLRRLAGSAAPAAEIIADLVAGHGQDGHRIVALAKRLAAGEAPPRDRPEVPVDSLIAVVAERLRLRPADIAGKRRHRPVVTARQLVLWLARRHTGHGLVAMGAFLGGRDHSTVLHALAEAERRRATDPAFRRLSDELDLAAQG